MSQARPPVVFGAGVRKRYRHWHPFTCATWQCHTCHRRGQLWGSVSGAREHGPQHVLQAGLDSLERARLRCGSCIDTGINSQMPHICHTYATHVSHICHTYVTHVTHVTNGPWPALGESTTGSPGSSPLW